MLVKRFKPKNAAFNRLPCLGLLTTGTIGSGRAYVQFHFDMLPKHAKLVLLPPSDTYLLQRHYFGTCRS
jgi:hypothetical protein